MKYSLIDPLVQTVSGIITASVSAAIVQTSWNMFAGMILGEIFGMLFMLILMIPLTAIFGGFEIMIPLFLITMSCGMVGGMLGTFSQISIYQTAFIGAVISLLIYSYVAWSDHKLKGQTLYEK